MGLEVEVDGQKWAEVHALAAGEDGGVGVALYDHPVRCRSARREGGAIILLFAAAAPGAEAIAVIAPGGRVPKGKLTLDTVGKRGGRISADLDADGIVIRGAADLEACGKLVTRPPKPSDLHFSPTDIAIGSWGVSVPAPRWEVVVERDLARWTSGPDEMQIRVADTWADASFEELFAGAMYAFEHDARSFGADVQVRTEGTTAWMTITLAPAAPEYRVYAWRRIDDHWHTICEGHGSEAAVQAISDACAAISVD